MLKSVRFEDHFLLLIRSKEEIAQTLASLSRQNARNGFVMKIVGMISVYNESDIIGSVLHHLISQGIELVILDNGSTDGSYEICSHYLGRGVLSLERLVTQHFEFDLLIQQLYQMALDRKADWILLSAADEFLESPYPGLTLKDSIIADDRLGCNLIQFNNFEFWPTEKDYQSLEADVRERMKYYTWNDDMQFRCWKFYPGVRVTGTTGHYPEFPIDVSIKIPRHKYILRHYRIRSYQHGLRKIFRERLPRYREDERKKGMNVHYDKFGTDPSYFIINSDNLNRYDGNGKWKVRKTFDWTWGLNAKSWAHPPATSLSVRFANSVPFAVTVWKHLFLKKKPLPLTMEYPKLSESETNPV